MKLHSFDIALLQQYKFAGVSVMFILILMELKRLIVAVFLDSAQVFRVEKSANYA